MCIERMWTLLKGSFRLVCEMQQAPTYVVHWATLEKYNVQSGWGVLDSGTPAAVTASETATTTLGHYSTNTTCPTASVNVPMHVAPGRPVSAAFTWSITQYSRTISSAQKQLPQHSRNCADRMYAHVVVPNEVRTGAYCAWVTLPMHSPCVYSNSTLA